MIHKWLLASLFFFYIVPLSAQEKGFERPDYKKIEHVTKDKSSEFYYPKLLVRYQADDTTLSMEQFKMLYYGFFFQEGYSSYGTLSEFRDSVKTLYSKDSLTNDDKLNMIRYTIDDLKTSPLSLRDLYRLYRSYNVRGDDANAAKYLHKLEMLSKVIGGTGDAQTDTTGIHVLYVDDEYAIVSMLGYEFGGTQKLTSNFCDYLTLKPNDDHIEGLYFDVKQMFIADGKKLEEKK